MKKNIGLYIHIPFCLSKCSYCDFYSKVPANSDLTRYADRICLDLAAFSEKYSDVFFDTVYFGGGTPTLLGGENIQKILAACGKRISDGAEITVEANPCTVTDELMKKITEAGVNRISLGVQSSNDRELLLLGRRHNAKQAANAAHIIQKSGINNVSFDLMLSIPEQTEQSLCDSIRFCKDNGASHISSYILKIEDGTPFYKIKDKLNLQSDDEQADRYLLACDLLEKEGYMQYEISNFSKKGYESRHNLKYWGCEEYIGFGPSAHSYLNGRRFYYSRDLEKYLSGSLKPTDDGAGGSFEEKLMLGLRLNRGINLDLICADETKKSCILKKAQPMIKAGYMISVGSTVSLTRAGFLISNAVIGELI